MPGSILNADINFPNFSGTETTDEKISVITNYLYMLYEQLRYSLSNLGEENFNKAGIKFIVDPITVMIKDEDEKITRLRIDVDGLATEVAGKITTYRQATVPTGANNGDLWYATADVDDYKEGTWYRYNGYTWDETSENIPVAPPWESGRPYSKGDIVDEGGKWYEALTNHTASESNKPPNSAYWVERQTISQVTKSQITQTMDNITLSVTTGQNGSVINMTSGDIRIQSPATYFETDEAHFSGSLSANKISTGALDADNISVRDSFAVQMKIDNVWTTVGYVGAGTGSDGQTITRGAVLKSADGNSYAIATNAGIRITSDDTSFYCTPDAIGYRLNGGPAIPFGQGEIAKFG